MKKLSIKILSALIIHLFVITLCLQSFASEVSHNDISYLLALRGEMYFSGESYTSNTNEGNVGNGEVSIDNIQIDEQYGKSVVLTAKDAENYTTAEGPWVQLDASRNYTNEKLSVYEMDIYVKDLTEGGIRFSSRGTGLKWSKNMIDITKDGIGLEGAAKEDRIPFEFGVWHKIRFLIDCNNYTFVAYVDDMENAVLSGSTSYQMANGIQFMRVVLVAKDAYAAVDNFKYYSLIEKPDGYEYPSVTLKCSPEKVTESILAKIQAQVQSDYTISNVEFFVDGVSQGKQTTAPYVLERQFEVGEYEICAVVTDEFCQTSEESIEISSLFDTRPKIQIDLEDGKEYERQSIDNVKISVTMRGESLVKDGSVFVDDVKIDDLTEGDNFIDMSALSVGKHKIDIKVTNNDDEYSEKSLYITVLKTFDDVVWSDNFNGGTSIVGELNGDDIGRFIERKIIRPDFSYSLRIGSKTAQDTSVEGAWIPVTLENAKSIVELDFDLYFNKINGNGLKTYMLFSDKGRYNLFKVVDSKIVMDKSEHEFKADKWYHVKIVMNVQKKQFSLYLDEELIFDNLSVNIPDGASVDTIRLVSMLDGEDGETYFAVDNMVVRHITQSPTILNITSENGDKNIVAARDNEIKVKFSGALQPSSVYPKKFELKGAVIKETTYNEKDFSVTLVLDKPLPLGKYQISTAENLVMGSGEIYAEKLYCNFEVKNSVLEADEADCYIETTLSSAKVNAIIKNNSQENKFAFIIINLYSNGKLKTSKIEKIELKEINSNLNIVSKDIVGYEDGDQIEVFVWDSVKKPICIVGITR